MDAPPSTVGIDVWLGMIVQAAYQTDHGGGTPLHDTDLLTRASWVDAAYACIQIQRVGMTVFMFKIVKE